MIWTIKIEMIYFEEPWSVTIELDSETLLDDLHRMIQAAVGFDNDHMYDFYIARSERSQKRTVFNDDNGLLYTTRLKSIYPLETGNKFYYLFDYGDDWLFKISKSRKKEHPAKEGITYPRIVSEVGSKPEQYSDWEE